MNLFKVFLLPAVLVAAAGHTHGVNLEWRTVEAFVIEACYDDGVPLSGAEVKVYMQSDPATPAVTGTCDESGRFIFMPDSTTTGNLDIQVIKDGHGGWIHLRPDTTGYTGGSSDAGLSTPRNLIVAVCVVWGFVGTALYFRHRHWRTDAHS